MSRIKMIIEYDGSNYHGFQIQANARTIQAEIENSLYKLTGVRTSVISAGRTDTGVHAVGQVIAFDSDATIPPEKWRFALNSFLPPDIRVIHSQAVGPEFHPRFDALSKHYSYLIYRQEQGETFMRKYAWCNGENLDIPEMEKACHFFTGTHNFKSFCAAGSSVKNYERQVKTCVLYNKGPYLNMEVCASGFLYNMVRIIMGTLIEVGRGNYPAEHVKAIIAAQDRSQAGFTAPAQGLYLLQVDYA